MSEYSLEEIKKLRRHNGSFYKGITVTRKASEYVDWLISALEMCRAEATRSEELINDWRGTIDIETVRGMEWKDRAEQAEAEIRKHNDYHCGGAILQAELNRQRRHRKWALIKLKDHLDSYLAIQGII